MRRKLLQDKKGDFTGALFFIASIAAFAIFLLIVGYIGKEVGSEMKTLVNSSSDEVNTAFDTTVNVSTTGLNVLWYIMFGGLLLGLMVTAWFVPTHPIFVAPFIIILIVSIMVGASMSNAYDELRVQADLAPSAAEQGGIGYMMGILPYIALIVGLLTLIVTFAKPGAGGGPAPPM